MIKIGTDIKENLLILLREVLDYEFIEYKRSNVDFQIFIIDIASEEADMKIKDIFLKGIPIIVVLGKNDIQKMRTLFLNKQVADCILRHDIYEIEKSIDRLKNSQIKYTQFYLNDIYQKGILEFSEVTYINYCRVSRRVQFNILNKEIFILKINFSTVETSLIEFANFYKVERGTIVNINLIKYLDYKEEKILFKDLSELYISKIKLKEIEENTFITKNKLYLRNTQ
ncbi:MAG: LytTR family transcriptional regulator DNA-binding domain-containing protein [Fusobacterium varium]|nr:LytTR family transcriptional regulator DNA-binding domain-containing protein [Fusobacterium varium]